MLKKLFSGVLALLLGASGAAAQTDTIVTAHGHRLVNHTRLPGNRPQPGDYALLQISTFIGDSLMGTTTGTPREWQLPLPASLPKRVPSLYDATLLLAKGDSATLLQSIDSMLRRNVPAALKAAQVVRYELVLVDFYNQAERDRRTAAKEADMKARLDGIASKTQALAKDFDQGKLKNKLQKTASGLQYIVHEPGAGAPLLKGEQIQVHYYGCLNNGKPFDNSFEGGEPLAFALGMGQMIPGFDEGAALLRHGSKATLFIPYRLGYGDQEVGGGVIPARSDLVFYLEVL